MSNTVNFGLPNDVKWIKIENGLPVSFSTVSNDSWVKYNIPYGNDIYRINHMVYSSSEPYRVKPNIIKSKL